MIDTRSRTSTTKSTRRRTTKKVLKLDESVNGELLNGSYSNHNETTTDFDRTWNSMEYNDYLDFSSSGSWSCGGKRRCSLSDILFGSSLFGFRWDLVEELQRKKSENLDNSRISHSTSEYEHQQHQNGGKKAPGFIFKYYKKFGFYWNVFPKTDYCYLPGSPDYQAEVSPGIPKVPNLSRNALKSYVRRETSSILKRTSRSGEEELEEVRERSESRLSSGGGGGFTEPPLMSSTALAESAFNVASPSEVQVRHKTRHQPTVGARKSTINHHSSAHREGRSSSNSWRIVQTLSQTLVTIIRVSLVTTVSSVSYLSTVSRLTSRTGGAAEGGRRQGSCVWLPLFIFLLLCLPCVYYLFPGVVGAAGGGGGRDGGGEVGLSSDGDRGGGSSSSELLAWSVASLLSAAALVKESLLSIPSLYLQLASLLVYNSSTTSPGALPPCSDQQQPSLQIQSAQPFPHHTAGFSANLTQVKLKELQTEIIEKLKTEMAGQNQHIILWIEQIQKQITNLTEEMKKMGSQLEDDQKGHFSKLEGELAELKKTVVEVREQATASASSVPALAASPSERMVERAVAKYHADRTGKPDYALESSGGYVMRVRCAQTYTKTSGNIFFLGIPIKEKTNGPETIIKPGVMPGECWAFEGSFAQVTLHLSTRVRVTAFSLEHSPKELAPLGHIASAPRHFSVWAMENEFDENPVFLGRFAFEDNGQSLQQFDAVPYEEAVELVELRIESNHGHPDYTCIYRFRVHGVPATLLEEEGGGGGLNSTDGGAGAKEGPLPSPSSDSPTKPYR